MASHLGGRLTRRRSAAVCRSEPPRTCRRTANARGRCGGVYSDAHCIRRPPSRRSPAARPRTACDSRVPFAPARGERPPHRVRLNPGRASALGDELRSSASAARSGSCAAAAGLRARPRRCADLRRARSRARVPRALPQSEGGTLRRARCPAGPCARVLRLRSFRGVGDRPRCARGRAAPASLVTRGGRARCGRIRRHGVHARRLGRVHARSSDLVLRWRDAGGALHRRGEGVAGTPLDACASACSRRMASAPHPACARRARPHRRRARRTRCAWFTDDLPACSFTSRSSPAIRENALARPIRPSARRRITRSLPCGASIDRAVLPRCARVGRPRVRSRVVAERRTCAP